jgi:hypothetical protein
MPETFILKDNYDMDMLIKACENIQPRKQPNKKQYITINNQENKSTNELDLLSKQLITISLLVSIVMIYTILSIQVIKIF